MDLAYGNYEDRKFFKGSYWKKWERAVSIPPIIPPLDLIGLKHSLMWDSIPVPKPIGIVPFSEVQLLVYLFIALIIWFCPSTCRWWRPFISTLTVWIFSYFSGILQVLSLQDLNLLSWESIQFCCVLLLNP